MSRIIGDYVSLHWRPRLKSVSQMYPVDPRSGAGREVFRPGVIKLGELFRVTFWFDRDLD